MPITGTVFKVTDLSGFLSSYLPQPDAPNPATFEPLAGARVTARLVSVAYASIPPDTTGSNGRFTIATPANAGTLRIQLLIQQPSPQAPGTLVPVFRSENVSLGQLLGKDLELYVIPTNFTAHVTQSQVNALVNDLKAQLDVAELTAKIQEGGVQLNAERGPVTVSAFIRVLPATSGNLNEIVTAKVENLDIDSFPCGLFTNEEEIEQQVRQGVRDVFEEANEDIRASFINTAATELGMPAGFVKGIVDQLVTIAINRLSFPYATSGGGRVIQARPTIGVPRRLVTPPPIVPPSTMTALRTAVHA